MNTYLWSQSQYREYTEFPYCFHMDVSTDRAKWEIHFHEAWTWAINHFGFKNVKMGLPDYTLNFVNKEDAALFRLYFS